MASKNLLRESKKCDKDEIKQKALVKKAIESNNMEGARIYAENAIRNHNQSLNFLKMSARIDSVAAKVQTAVSTQKVTGNMVKVCRTMEGVMNSMNLEKISEMMERFEKQFENLDVQMNVMDNTMQSTSAQMVPEDDVMKLMNEKASEAGIDLRDKMPSVQNNPLQSNTTTNANEKDLELENRLKALRDL